MNLYAFLAEGRILFFGGIIMASFTFPVKSFKRFDDPQSNFLYRVKYRFYVEAKSVPKELLEWMETNPREQNLSTDVARDITASLKSNDRSFHLWNRGVLFSADEVSYDNKTLNVTVQFTNPQIHGNIDGGHTLRIICESNQYNQQNPNAYSEQYVEFEIITGLESPILLAEARNTSTQVDTSSIEELRNSFDCIKNIIGAQRIQGEYYLGRISFKQNQHHDNPTVKNIIDIREFIAIINMFSPILYPLSGGHPLQSYTGKETSLKKFLNMGNHKDEKDSIKKASREEEVQRMANIIPDIIELWDKIECELPVVSKQMNKRYGRKSYSGYKEDDKKRPVVAGVTIFSNKPIYYLVPKGLMYPLVGAFRALVDVDHKTGNYVWVDGTPFAAWDSLKEKLIESILNSSSEQNDNPNAIGKSISAWGSLFDKVYIYSLERKVATRK